MNFLQAFSETIGKEVQNPNPTPTPEVKQNGKVDLTSDLTSDDMKAYVDAKFEALKSDLLNELKPVETPKETDDKNAKLEEKQVEDADDDVNNE